LKKQDKDLNLLLADVYEREKKYQNAAYIYQDMLELFPSDEFMLQRLGNIHSLL
jgi:cytochrome c-type biogenesis protein CcmH/NrfG